MARRRIFYRDRGTQLHAQLQELQGGQWVKLTDTVVPYALVQKLLATRAGRPDLLPENAPGPTEMGWGFWNKIKRFARKVAHSKLVRAIQSVGRKFLKVTAVLDPILEKIPIIGVFAKLHEKLVAPMERALFSAKAALKTATDPAKVAQLKRVIKLAVVKRALGQRQTLALSARIKRLPAHKQARAARLVLHRLESYKVVTPSGKTVFVKV